MGIYEKMDRVTVAEAAARLGVKEQAIRKRIQRGTIIHYKDEDGRVYVYLDAADGAAATSSQPGMNTLVKSLQDQIVYLRQEAEDWKEEARRKDTIIVSLTQRIPGLPFPQETPGVPEMSAEGTTNGNLAPGPQEPTQRRSWLYRFFFGP